MRALIFLVILGLFAATMQSDVLLQKFRSTHLSEYGVFGREVSSVPDTDGDGLDDLIVGAPGEEIGGRVYLFSGATGALLHDFSSPNAILNGEFGAAVAGLDDVDGDGRGDLLIGAYMESPNGIMWAGEVYLFSGATSELIRSFVSPNQEPQFFGFSVARVPDVDGDGINDLVSGARAENFYAGRAYVFSGLTGTLLQSLISPNEESAGDFGIAVAGVPDSNGDGRGDVLISAFGERRGRGRAYEFSGATGQHLHTLITPNVQLNGAFGLGLAGLDDVNGDGRGDLFVGAYAENFSSGHAYVFDGATGALLYDLKSPHPEKGGDFGSALSEIPDVNGDGIADLLVGAQSENGNHKIDAGRAYVFSGATAALLQTIVSPQGSESRGFFAGAVTGVRDLDGDGRGDALIGAYFEDRGSGIKRSGKAYLFSGASALR